jgi:glyoxylase-like metal-dependent hydrolase (beta-lactamase superfamily II)
MRGPVEIVPGVYGLGTEMVNWYLVEDGGRLTAVDAGLPGYRETLDADLQALGHGMGDVEAVVLTHCDADHTGLANAFKEAGARVLIHSADERRLRKPGPKSGDASLPRLLSVIWKPGTIRLFRHMAKYGGGARPPAVEPTATFEHGDLLDVPGHPTVVPTPGHTEGHCAIHFEGRSALFAGDALCTWHPISGRTGPQLMPSSFNVSNDQALRSLSAIEAIDAQAMLLGHGAPWREGPSAAAARARAIGRT